MDISVGSSTLLLCAEEEERSSLTDVAICDSVSVVDGSNGFSDSSMDDWD